MLRLLARSAPVLLGVVAAAIWLRRRQPERPALPLRKEPAPAGRFEHTPVDIVTVVDDLLGAAR
jgi:uncharacterized iron-regulated membrane protein